MPENLKDDELRKARESIARHVVKLLATGEITGVEEVRKKLDKRIRRSLINLTFDKNKKLKFKPTMVLSPSRPTYLERLKEMEKEKRMEDFFFRFRWLTKEENRAKSTSTKRGE